jgi:cation:H+ antiporter
MDIALQVFLFLGGLTVALLASGRAVEYTRALAAALGAPAFLVGVALVSIGTDLPELANAVASHLSGEGDVNVGTAVGSALVQYTFVVGLFPLVIAVILIGRREVLVIGVLTMAGLGLTTLFVADGWLSRWEGAILIVAWAVGLLIVLRTAPGLVPDEPPPVKEQRKLLQAGIVLGALAIVGVGATVAVESLVRLAEQLGVPEFLLGFFGASVGTSAPELVVDLTALARGAPGIAFGDAFGSSLVDSTLTVGVGATVAPAEVTPRLAITGSVYSLLAVAGVSSLLAARRRHDKLSGAVFVGFYALAYVVLITIGR